MSLAKHEIYVQSPGFSLTCTCGRILRDCPESPYPFAELNAAVLEHFQPYLEGAVKDMIRQVPLKDLVKHLVRLKGKK